MAATSRARRLTWIVSVGLVLVASLLLYQKYFLARPIGSGPAGPAISADHFRQTWTDRPVQLIGLGDSVTEGFGADRPAHSYFQRLIRNPPDEFSDMQGRCLSAVLPNLESKNASVSGTTSLEHWDSLDLRLGPTAADDVFGLVVMTTGGNDLIHNYGRTPPREGAMYGATLAQAQPWIKNFGERLDKILQKISAHFPGGCEIYLADIYDPTDNVGDAPSVFLPDWPDGLAILAAYNEVIHQVAAQHANAHLVPLHSTFLGHGSHCCQFWRKTYQSADPHYWFYDNIEDPNERGYDAIRRIFLQEIVTHSQLVPGGKILDASQDAGED